MCSDWSDIKDIGKGVRIWQQEVARSNQWYSNKISPNPADRAQRELELNSNTIEDNLITLGDVEPYQIGTDDHEAGTKITDIKDDCRK